MIEIEIACNSYISCENAVKAGASRIELFENLHDGGCTPASSLIHIAAKLSLPVYVMIRPRGGHFVYSTPEIDMMLHDIEVCKNAKVSGIVFGCLTSEGQIDQGFNKKLLDAWNGPATFHRAIDRTSDIMEAAKQITSLGFERILSSGGAISAVDGLNNLRKLQKEYGKHIHIQPGAGITAKNAVMILKETGCTSLHATCKTSIMSNTGTLNPCFMSTDTETFSELDTIKKLVREVAKIR